MGYPLEYRYSLTAKQSSISWAIILKQAQRPNNLDVGCRLSFGASLTTQQSNSPPNLEEAWGASFHLEQAQQPSRRPSLRECWIAAAFHFEHAQQSNRLVVRRVQMSMSYWSSTNVCCLIGFSRVSFGTSSTAQISLSGTQVLMGSLVKYSFSMFGLVGLGFSVAVRCVSYSRVRHPQR